MKKFFSLILCVALAFSFLGCQITEDKKSEDTVISFEDKILEKIIREKINKPTGDILKSDVSLITELDASRKVINCTDGDEDKISTINGIENLTNLKVLKLALNSISDISTLENLNNLTDLDITDNKISNIDPLKNLTKLTSLALGGNQINNINSLSNLKQLTRLNLYHSNIDNIDALKELAKLESLFIGDNNLDNSDLSSLEKLDKLKELYLDGNNISDYSPLQNIITNLWAFNSCDVDNAENMKVKSFVKESHSWIKLLTDAKYHTTGKTMGVFKCDQGNKQEIKEVEFDNSTDKEIIKLLKKYYSCDNLINAQLYGWGFIYINDSLYKLDGLFTEPYIIGRMDAISLTLDQPNRKVVKVPKEHPGHTYPSSGFLYNSSVEFIYVETIKDANGNWIISSIEGDSYDPNKIELNTSN